MAMTGSPTEILSEDSRRSTGKWSACTRSSAISVAASAPITWAGSTRSSASFTRTVRAPSMTWRLVTMSPSARMMNPEPSADPFSPGAGLPLPRRGEHAAHERAHVVVLSVAGRPLYGTLPGAFAAFLDKNSDDAWRRLANQVGVSARHRSGCRMDQLSDCRGCGQHERWYAHRASSPPRRIRSRRRHLAPPIRKTTEAAIVDGLSIVGLFLRGCHLPDLCRRRRQATR